MLPKQAVVIVKFIVEKIKPGRGFSHAFHLSFLAVLPLVLLLLARLDFNTLALAVLLLSKWRMLAVHPRHWLAHIRTNAVDIIVGLSLLTFIIESSSIYMQGFWVVLFEVWLLLIKPKTDTPAIALQAAVAQALGASSIFFAFEEAPITLLVLVYWVVAYFSARHFFNAFEETRGHLLSSIWAFFNASLIWVLAHWLLFVGPVAQPALIVSGIGFGLAGMYYLKKVKRLSPVVRRQIIITMFALLFVLIIFSDWGDKAV